MGDFTLPPFVNESLAETVANLMTQTVIDGDWMGTPHWRNTTRLYGHGDGYRVAWHPRLRRSTGAHRISQEAFVGPIPDGYEVDHLCRFTPCWSPFHTEAVTPEENRRRAAPYRFGETCLAGHPMSGANVIVKFWSGKHRRVCLTCWSNSHPTTSLGAREGEANARDESGVKTHCLRGHALTPQNVYLGTNSKGTVTRTCRTCAAAQRRARRLATRQQEMPA